MQCSVITFFLRFLFPLGIIWGQTTSQLPKTRTFEGLSARIWYKACVNLVCPNHSSRSQSILVYLASPPIFAFSRSWASTYQIRPFDPRLASPDGILSAIPPIHRPHDTLFQSRKNVRPDVTFAGILRGTGQSNLPNFVRPFSWCAACHVGTNHRDGTTTTTIGRSPYEDPRSEE
jgi:hypothetical protein